MSLPLPATAILYESLPSVPAATVKAILQLYDHSLPNYREFCKSSSVSDAMLNLYESLPRPCAAITTAAMLNWYESLPSLPATTDTAAMLNWYESLPIIPYATAEAAVSNLYESLSSVPPAPIKKRKRSIITNYNAPKDVKKALLENITAKELIYEKIKRTLLNHQRNYDDAIKKMDEFAENPSLAGKKAFKNSSKAAHKYLNYITKKKQALAQAEIRVTTAYLQYSEHKKALKITASNQK